MICIIIIVLINTPLITWKKRRKHILGERGILLVKMRTLDSILKYEPILRRKTPSQKTSHHHPEVLDSLRITAMKEFDDIIAQAQRRDWSIVEERTESLIRILNHLANEAIDGHSASGIADELSNRWCSIISAGKKDDEKEKIWPEFAKASPRCQALLDSIKAQMREHGKL